MCLTKGLHTMGRNTKRPNTTKGPINPKQKLYKNYKRVLILRSEANMRSLSKGIGHDSINCYDDPKPRLHHCLQVGENSTSNFSVLLPTTKHTYISTESTQNLNSLKIEIKCFLKNEIKIVGEVNLLLLRCLEIVLQDQR